VEFKILHEKRLCNEYQELMRLNGNIIKIEPCDNPLYEQHKFYEHYKITFNIRTIINPTPEYRMSTVCELHIPPGYPRAAPKLICISNPVPWHVNWYQSGVWDYGCWDWSNPLSNFIIRCAKTLQFDPLVTNVNSCSNHDALKFWNENRKNQLIIPCDGQTLPSVDSGVTPKYTIKITKKEDDQNVAKH